MAILLFTVPAKEVYIHTVEQCADVVFQTNSLERILVWMRANLTLKYTGILGDCIIKMQYNYYNST